MKPRIRIATPADAAEITAIINSAFRIAEGFFIDGNRITQAEVENLLAKGAFLLAEADGKLNGCVYVEPRSERSYAFDERGGKLLSRAWFAFHGHSHRQFA